MKKGYLSKIVFIVISIIATAALILFDKSKENDSLSLKSDLFSDINENVDTDNLTSEITSQVKDNVVVSSVQMFAMDTIMDLKVYGYNRETTESALHLAETEIDRLDNLLSSQKKSSEIYQLNVSKDSYVSDDTRNLVEKAMQFCAKTDGKFDITVAPIMNLWGFYSKNFYVPTPQEIADKLSYVDYNDVKINGNHIILENNAQIDLGGIAKGFTSDRVMQILRANQIEAAIVSLGGNVQTLGKKTDGTLWKVAIQNPSDTSDYIAVVDVADKAVITSGTYQRYFEQDGVKYHHIIDPGTGYPSDSGLASVTIVSTDGTVADALSTSLFVMGLEKAIEYWRADNSFDAIFVTDDGKVYYTLGLEGAIQISDGYESLIINIS